MAAGNGMENIQALIPNVVSGEAASAEEITQYPVWEEEPAYVRWEARYAQREREIERGTKRYISINNMQ